MLTAHEDFYYSWQKISNMFDIWFLSVTSDKNIVKVPRNLEILLIQLVTNNKCALQVHQSAAGLGQEQEIEQEQE